MRGLFVWAAAWGCAAWAQEIRFTPVATGIAAPTDIQHAGDGSGRLFVAQQNGLVRVLRGTTLEAAPFLDIRSKTRGQGERGLLGLAFPPGYAEKQRFYVNYTDLNGDTVIAQYRAAGGAADPASEVVLLHIAQPFSNHNGGQLRFGPDGFLYIGMGDGGSGGDPQGNAQNPASLLGKMLRVDVESEPGQVRIPPGNPLAATAGARGEIWALGLRNPWRFSFDRATGDLWIADVGQNVYEEVHYQPASSRGGENYGWNRMEGAHCFQPGCSQQGLVLPVAEYTHAEGCSITGGFVYRGAGSPGLRGTYLYGDYCSGRMWGVVREGGGWAVRTLADSGFDITTFGEDEAGEVYVADGGRGAIYRIEGQQAPRLGASGVVNAAGFQPGLAAGSLATIFAAGLMDSPGAVEAAALPLPVTLAGVSATIGGVAAPVHSVANRNGVEQVNVQVPYDVRGRSSAAVVVSRDGRAAPPVEATVLEVQPAVYTSDGVHALAVRNADYSLAGEASPLAPGEYAFVYVSGLGRAAGEPPTGSAAPASPPAAVPDVRATLAGLPCEVSFAGLAPGFVGVYQVNFRVPFNAPSGSQDLVVSAGGVPSPAVKAAVR